MAVQPDIQRYARGFPALLLASGVAALGLSACAHTAAVPAGKPMQPAFAPPAGLVQYEHFIERRAARVAFPSGETAQVLEAIAGRAEERYEPLPDGGYRVISTVLDERSSRNGQLVSLPLSLVGVPLVHVVDARGRFVDAEDLEATAEVLRSRIVDRNQRRAMEPLLSAQALSARMRRSWEVRFQNVCGAQLTPGETFFALDEQELPGGGTARSVSRQEVFGLSRAGTREAAALRVTFGGRGSAVSKSPGASHLVSGLLGGEGELTPQVEGTGERFVSLSTCQTVRESARISGELRLDKQAARASGATGFPERVRFEIHREVWRTLPGEPDAPPPFDPLPKR